MAATKKTTTKTAPAKKAAATETRVKTPADTAPRAPMPSTFDARANKLATKADREARAAGKDPGTSEFTVAPGRFVRQGGERWGEGSVISLTKADGERLKARGAVVPGTAGQKLVDEKNAAAEQAAGEKAAAEEAQRAADEKAAQDKAAADEAAGKMSGAENH